MTGWAGAFGGPASVGFLVIRRGVRWRAPYPVDDYQDGRWPGPPDVPAIHAAAVALRRLAAIGRAVGDTPARADRPAAGASIAAAVPDVDLAGDPVDRVPHLLTFSALYVDGETLTLELDRAGFAVASGSACSASSETPSHVLAAMGALTHGNVRIGLTRTHHRAPTSRASSTVLPADRRRACRAAAGRAMIDKPDDVTAQPSSDRWPMLDCLGMKCPRPIIELARRFAEVAVGELVEICGRRPGRRSRPGGLVPDARTRSWSGRSAPVRRPSP